jgi:(S)-ureidoglycine aminohydrolase
MSGPNPAPPGKPAAGMAAGPPGNPAVHAPAAPQHSPAGAPAYAGPIGGLPPQIALTTDSAIFTDAYAVIPRQVMRDIVTSFLPGWTGMRMWILARPLSGFAETFSQYVVELAPGGGADSADPDPGVEHALFVTAGRIAVTIAGRPCHLGPGGFAYVPPGSRPAIFNAGEAAARFHWWRKRYQPAEGLAPPDPILVHEQDIAPAPMPDSGGAWATTRFMDPADLRHDMHITIVTFRPGGSIPFAETHVMEHGLFVLEGKAVYRLNRDWVEVGPGDFMWLRAFCPQACYAGGPGPFRYLLYKDVNRHAALGLPGPGGRPF